MNQSYRKNIYTASTNDDGGSSSRTARKSISGRFSTKFKSDFVADAVDTVVFDKKNPG